MTTESRSNYLSENGTTMSQRWCIYIDILGFSHFWGNGVNWEALYPLRELMRALFRIGTKVYPNDDDRLFVHQMGDGFAIVSNFGECSLERPICIAIALMRHVAASTGKFTAATIAEGEFGAIQGCYPPEVMDCHRDGRVRLGRGLMTLSTVMGTAFIRAYDLHNKSSGPFLTLSDCYRSRIPEGLSVRATEDDMDTRLLSIDWGRAETSLLKKIQVQAGLMAPEPDELVQTIRNYCMQYPHIHEKWRIALNELLSIKVDINLDE